MNAQTQYQNEAPIISVASRVLNPAVIVGSLAGLTLAFGKPFDGYYLVLAILASVISARVYEDIGLDRCWRSASLILHLRDVLVGWGIIISILLFLGYITKFSQVYSRSVLLTWIVVTPVLLLLSQVVAREILRRYGSSESGVQMALIAGITELGCTLADKINRDPYNKIRVAGFFEDREDERRVCTNDEAYLGKLADLPGYARTHHISIIYITLPMVESPRIKSLLEELHDTTASVYFVPDIFMFDLMHARFGQIHGIPLVTIRDTPMQGMHSFYKRISDALLALIILMLLTPLMLLIALAVRFSSPGPVMFKQRRYGMNGEEIIVYKFRSMTVSEDGGNVIQATKNDARVTKLGAFLRRTSLDELPQFINVIQGRMSIVGPRPHAVAHNELYRKLIRGYMIRHKVKPGITGWAQIHGLRGETDTIDKMQKRIEYDLEYIRNWSLSLDLWIILRTVLLVLRDKQAY